MFGILKLEILKLVMQGKGIWVQKQQDGNNASKLDRRMVFGQLQRKRDSVFKFQRCYHTNYLEKKITIFQRIEDNELVAEP